LNVVEDIPRGGLVRLPEVSGPRIDSRPLGATAVQLNCHAAEKLIDLFLVVTKPSDRRLGERHTVDFLRSDSTAYRRIAQRRLNAAKKLIDLSSL
jgi:hypothetical protein